MALRKAILSLITWNSITKDKHTFNDSTVERRIWSREIEKKDGLHAQYTWIRDHKAELQEGKNLVQREMHVSAQLLHHQTLVDQESFPDLSLQEQILNYEAELRRINQECVEHRVRLAELESYKPPGQVAGNHLVLFGQHANPEAWKAEREKCQSHGGCCARDCGCCERNLRTVRDRAGGLRYLHCSRGCACCARHRGERRGSSSSSTRSRHPSVHRPLTPDGYVP